MGYRAQRMMADRFERIGNNLSADFANTAYSSEQTDGSLHSARDVLDFLTASNTLSTGEATRFRRALAHEADARRFLTLALGLRSAVTASLGAVENGRMLDAASLAVLNGILESDAGYEHLEHRRGSRYALVYERIRADVTSVLVPLARDTAKLLVTPNAPIRRCTGDGCIRYFYDGSRTKRRRWCDMAICGNRAKAAAFAKRHGRSRSGRDTAPDIAYTPLGRAARGA